MKRVPLFPALALVCAVALIDVVRQSEAAFVAVLHSLSPDDGIVTGSTEKKDAKEQEPFVSNSSETDILNRLQQRREALEQREKQLDLRESLLKAADQKLESRIEELKALEARAKQGDAPGGEAQTIKQLALMYETMKPKDAARVLERLDMSVLLPVAQAIAPRKFAEILAVMTPAAAERLTLELARSSRGGGPLPVTPTAVSPLPPGELPAIAPPKAP